MFCFTLLHGIDSVFFFLASQIRNKCGVHRLIVDLALNRIFIDLQLYFALPFCYHFCC